MNFSNRPIHSFRISCSADLTAGAIDLNRLLAIRCDGWVSRPYLAKITSKIDN